MITKSNLYKKAEIFLFFFTLSLFFPSCIMVELFRPSSWKLLKMSFNEERTCKNQCLNFIYENDRIYIPVAINGILDTFLLDMGYSSKIFWGYYGNDRPLPKTYKKPIKVAGGKTIYLSTSYDNYLFENKLVECKNCVGTSIFFPNLPPCKDPSYTKKSAGYSLLLAGYNRCLFLNFSDKEICLYDSIQPDTTGYFRIKSSFESKQVFIYMTIDNIEYMFLFDTGCGGTLLIRRDKHIPVRDAEDTYIDGKFAENVKGAMISDTTIIKKEQIVYYTPTASKIIEDIYYADNISKEYAYAGMEFISQFDWIIDAKNKSVYAKPVKKETEKKEIIEMPRYFVTVSDNKLVVASRNLNKNPVYPLGTIIESVNGETITKENICKYYLILNTAIWDTLNVDVKF